MEKYIGGGSKGTRWGTAHNPGSPTTEDKHTSEKELSGSWGGGVHNSSFPAAAVPAAKGNQAAAAGPATPARPATGVPKAPAPLHRAVVPANLTTQWSRGACHHGAPSGDMSNNSHT